MDLYRLTLKELLTLTFFGIGEVKCFAAYNSIKTRNASGISRGSETP